MDPLNPRSPHPPNITTPKIKIYHNGEYFILGGGCGWCFNIYKAQAGEEEEFGVQKLGTHAILSANDVAMLLKVPTGLPRHPKY